MVDFISFTPTQFIDRQQINTLVNDLNSKNKIEFFKKAEVLLSVINIKNIFIDHFNNDKKTQEITNKESKFVLSEQDATNNINKNKALDDIDETLSIFDKVSRAMPSDASEDDYPIDSLSDLFDNIKESIIAGKNDYLDVLKDIFSKYMDFVNALREALSKLSECTKAGEKDGYINVDLTKIVGELNKVVSEFTNNESTDKLFFEFKMPYLQDEDGRYYRIVDNEKIYYGSFPKLFHAKEKIADLLKGIKGIVVSESSSNDSSEGEDYFKIEAGIDLSAIEDFLKSLRENGLGKKDMLQTEFDLLKKALDALEKKINTNLDELSKKYSSANSNYDNFVKIVSSTMNTLLEMAKGFLRL